MMNGPSIPRASQARTAAESATIATSHAQAGTARNRSATELDLAEPGRDLARGRRVRLDPDLGGRPAHLAEDIVGDGTTTCGLLERADVEVGNAVEVVLQACELARSLAHRRPDLRARGEEVERGGEGVDLVRVDR